MGCGTGKTPTSVVAEIMARMALSSTGCCCCCCACVPFADEEMSASTFGVKKSKRRKIGSRGNKRFQLLRQAEVGMNDWLGTVLEERTADPEPEELTLLTLPLEEEEEEEEEGVDAALPLPCESDACCTALGVG